MYPLYSIDPPSIANHVMHYILNPNVVTERQITHSLGVEKRLKRFDYLNHKSWFLSVVVRKVSYKTIHPTATYTHSKRGGKYYYVVDRQIKQSEKKKEVETTSVDCAIIRTWVRSFYFFFFLSSFYSMLVLVFLLHFQVSFFHFVFQFYSYWELFFVVFGALHCRSFIGFHCIWLAHYCFAAVYYCLAICYICVVFINILRLFSWRNLFEWIEQACKNTGRKSIKCI